MRSGRLSTLIAFAAFAAFVELANAQSVISTRSGVIHFFEGAVYLDDQPLEPHLARFPSLSDGSELRTGEGRAEVLLTPGVFLRMNSQSAVRMVSSDLADTQVELLAGSVMVESGVPNADTSVTLIYRDWGIHLLREGVYRIDSDPAQLWVRQGAAEVFAGDGAEPVSVDSGMNLRFADVLAPERSIGEPADALRDWQEGRSESISADDAITAQIDEDPASRAPGADGFIGFPLLGVSTVGMDSAGLYGGGSGLCMVGLCQPGFSSIYLPGYTYRPMILSLVGRAPASYYSSPSRLQFGGLPGTGVVIGPVPRLPALPPISLGSHPAPIRIAPPRLGGGRR